MGGNCEGEAALTWVQLPNYEEHPNTVIGFWLLRAEIPAGFWQVEVWRAHLSAKRQHQPGVPCCRAQGACGAVQEKRLCGASEDQEDEGGGHIRAGLAHREEGWQRRLEQGVLPVGPLRSHPRQTSARVHTGSLERRERIVVDDEEAEMLLGTCIRVMGHGCCKRVASPRQACWSAVASPQI